MPNAMGKDAFREGKIAKRRGGNPQKTAPKGPKYLHIQHLAICGIC